jgi:hypothetical protein
LDNDVFEASAGAVLSGGGECVAELAGVEVVEEGGDCGWVGWSWGREGQGWEDSKEE